MEFRRVLFRSNRVRRPPDRAHGGPRYSGWRDDARADQGRRAAAPLWRRVSEVVGAVQGLAAGRSTRSYCHVRARGEMGWETVGVNLTRSRGGAEEDAEGQKGREDFER